MKLAVLFSGGKDSCLATYLAQQHEEVVCLLSITSENKDSYMFHTPNISKTKEQATALNIPLLEQVTNGVKEEELDDLYELILRAKKEYTIEGVVTGAINSVYQATRVEKICSKLNVYCFHPVWQRDPKKHVEDLLDKGFEMLISAVAAHPLDTTWLGRPLNNQALQELTSLQETFQINLAGEGGEYESFVTYAPLWSKRLITQGEAFFKEGAGTYTITNIKQEAVTNKPDNYSFDFFPKNNNNVLLVDTSSHKLSYYEFVLPVRRVVEKTTTCDVCSLSEFNESLAKRYEKIIICGNPIQDNVFVNKDISFLKKEQQVLGICAGAQLLAKLLQLEITTKQKIGMYDINEQTALGEVKEAYFVQQHSIKESCYKRNNWFIISFHPEVRNEHVIKNFLVS